MIGVRSGVRVQSSGKLLDGHSIEPRSMIFWVSVIQPPPQVAFPASHAEDKKFNRRLVAPTPCNIKSRRWLRMRPSRDLNFCLGVVVLTADFKF
jgi:hypothetical protein